MVVKFVDDLAVAVAREKLNIAVEIAKGNCGDMNDYKRRCGMIVGMDRVIDIAKAQLKKLDDDAEEAA